MNPGTELAGQDTLQHAGGHGDQKPWRLTLAPIQARWLEATIAIAIAAAGVVALIVQYRAVMEGYMTDDAFISFRYAQNWADGLGPVWSRGESVEGYTNFGWVAAMAAGIKIGVDPIDASRALSLLASAGMLALVPVLAAQLRPAWTARWWVLVAGVTAALSLNSGMSLWTFAGLETTAQAFFVMAGVTVHLWEERTQSRPLWSAPLLVVAALLRPDAVVFVAIVGLHKAARLIARDWRAELPRLIVWGALFAVPFGAYWLWRWSYYGYFMPNTYYLKTARSAAFFERGWDYARDFALIYWGWLALAALASAWRERAAAYRPATFLLVLAGASFLYIVSSGGDWMPYYRFFVPALPFIYVLAVHGVIDCTDLVFERNERWRPAALGTMALLAAIIAFSAVRPYDNATAKQSELLPTMGGGLPGAVTTTEPRSIGLWLRDTFPPDTTTAIVATGTVPYYSRLPTLDMLGVNDEHIAHLDVELGVGPAGHEKWDGAYIIEQQPDIIWLQLGAHPEQRTEIEHYMPPFWGPGWPLADEILQNGFVWDLYEPLSVPYEGGGYINLLVHKSLELPPEDALFVPLRPAG